MKTLIEMSNVNMLSAGGDNPNYSKSAWKNKDKSASVKFTGSYQDSIYLLINYGNIRTMCEICSELTINVKERGQWRRSDVFIVSFKQDLNIVLVFLTLTLKK